MEVGNGMKALLIFSWYQYVYTFMPVCSVLSCMVLHLYKYLHVCLNSIYGLKKKIKREALRPATSWSNWQVNHVSVGRISVCACL